MNEKYIHRDIEPILIKSVKQFPAIAITGPRQSGKSTLLQTIFSSFQYITFDDPLIREQAISDPKKFLDDLKEPVIIDEIQYVPEILSYLKIAIDQKRSQKGRFLLTGSQQFNLIKNLGDSLAGRIGLFTLLPFNKHEKQTLVNSKKASQIFIDACLRGSYPEISVDHSIDFETWYGSYLQTYLERDVRAISEIGSLREFQRFMQLLASRCSQVLNMNTLASDLGVAVNTIKKWISILEASNLIFLLNPYYSNLGKRITKTPKLYFLDCGLVCYLTGIRDKQHLLNGPMAGPLFENYTISETVKAFYNQGRIPNIFYLRTHSGLEVDLIIEKNLKLYLFEIKLNQTPTMAMSLPIQKVVENFPNLPWETGWILSLSNEKNTLYNNITVQPLDDYLKWLAE
ncbi:MAG: ATPase (AAA+ superfamily) [uncultured bacterium]|uniref:ATPase (AAA+ superfamily) n=1 Tax=Berkelbacteria bacterium GW2011_GWA2_38_9 TaxID=1618334 RepID=A0A0G0LAZ4_9BACT|nr:MAG: ATPase (AAA+ superfamily) [uncultured bacterium]KKQ88152.1 MAG: ATPase (AAA+ superfamily) [Berkelbacteria bacterium GW2011_GWA2_38_9]